MPSIPPATVWGSPSASKRALCLHGLTSSSQTWFRVAEGLVDQGYTVIAPDLLGHGLARRGFGVDYTVRAMAEDIDGLIKTSPPFDAVIGHSLGGLLALELIPVLLTYGTNLHVMLVDPPLEVSQEEVNIVLEGCMVEVTRVPSVEQYKAGNPLWTDRDAIAKVIAAHLCDPEAVAAILTLNYPWSFTHLLPPPTSRLRLTILGADPSKDPSLTRMEAEALATSRPDVTIVTIYGASHSIHREFPDAIISAALKADEGKVMESRAIEQPVP